MTKPISIQSPEVITRLWINESLRVFYDRLINNEDKKWFIDLVHELLLKNFRMNFDPVEIFEIEDEAERNKVWLAAKQNYKKDTTL